MLNIPPSTHGRQTAERCRLQASPWKGDFTVSRKCIKTQRGEGARRPAAATSANDQEEPWPEKQSEAS